MEKEYCIIIMVIDNEGDWKNGKKDGKGTYYYNDGQKEEGNWKNDNFQKKGFFW